MSLSFFQAWQNEFSTHPKLKLFWEAWSASSILLFLPMVIYLFTRPNGKVAILMLVVSVLLARGVVAEIIYFFYKKQRPYQKYALKPPEFFLFSFTTHREDSFPSGHIIAMSAMACVFSVFSFWLGIIAYSICVMTALARVLTAYHYPKDVVVGFILGSLCGFLTIYLYILGYLPNILKLV
jgi:membrane-associated phospholipid phosphatase